MDSFKTIKICILSSITSSIITHPIWSKYVYNQHRIRSLILNLCQTLSNTKECPFYIKGSQRHFSETVRLYPAKCLHTNTLKYTFKPERGFMKK